MSDSRIVSVTKARQKLFGLIDEVNESSEPITIKGKRGNAVLVSEDVKSEFVVANQECCWF